MLQCKFNINRYQGNESIFLQLLQIIDISVVPTYYSSFFIKYFFQNVFNGILQKREKSQHFLPTSLTPNKWRMLLSMCRYIVAKTAVSAPLMRSLCQMYGNSTAPCRPTYLTYIMQVTNHFYTKKHFEILKMVRKCTRFHYQLIKVKRALSRMF